MQEFDYKIYYDKQITSIFKMAYVNLKDMYQVQSCMQLDSSETMVHTFITSFLDYCNSLLSVLYGLSTKQIKKLQTMQNTAARLVTNSFK